MSEAHSKHWYDLFSRGARDWLRHNQKIRETVKERLPRLIAEADVLNASGNRSIRMPVKMLDHYRFRLSREKRADGRRSGQRQAGRRIELGAGPAGERRSGRRQSGWRRRVHPGDEGR